MRKVAALAGVVLAAIAFAPCAHADQIRDRQLPLLRTLNVPQAWAMTKGAGVTVAVVDSGVDPNQADLRGNVTVGPNMLAATDGGRAPQRWHGTGMASLIAGHGHGPGGNSGIIGVAPESKILAVRVIAETGDPGYVAYRTSRASQDAVARGIRYAADNGADVINLSLGNNRPNPEERKAVAHAIAKGVVVVSAVGNDGNVRERLDGDGFAPYSYPASYPGVIAVAATTAGHERAEFSNRNYSVLLSAPGVGIPVAGPGDEYFPTEGTSNSSALVSGIAALIRSRHPDMKPSLVRQALLASTRFGPTGKYDASVGFGEVNAAAAVQAADTLAGTPRGTGAHPSGRRFGQQEPGPVKVIDQPAWAEPVAVAAILLTLVGAAFAVILAITLFRRSREARRWASTQPAMALGPPLHPPPPLVFDPDAPPSPPQVTPVFERPDAPTATEMPVPEQPASPPVPPPHPGGPPTFEEAPDKPEVPHYPERHRYMGVQQPPPGAGPPTFEPPA